MRARRVQGHPKDILIEVQALLQVGTQHCRMMDALPRHWCLPKFLQAMAQATSGSRTWAHSASQLRTKGTAVCCCMLTGLLTAVAAHGLRLIPDPVQATARR